jgi:hypothetical protein
LTKHDPPNVAEFDGVHDGRLSAVKSRRCTGPHPATVQFGSVSDSASMLMAASLPLLGNLSSKCAWSLSPIKAPPAVPKTPTHHTLPSPPISPFPGISSELCTCLSDFVEAKGIDMTACEDALLALKLTPDIIPLVPVDRLCSVTGAVEGRIRKLQVFCSQWEARLKDKRAHLAAKKQRID